MKDFLSTSKNTLDLHARTNFLEWASIEEYLYFVSHYDNRDNHPDNWNWNREIDNAETYFNRSGEIDYFSLIAAQVRDIVPHSISTYFREKKDIKNHRSIFPFIGSYNSFRNWTIDNAASERVIEAREALATATKKVKK